MTKTAKFTNCVDSDVVAHYEPRHQDLPCLSSRLRIFNMIQLDKAYNKIFVDVNFVIFFLALKELSLGPG